MATRTRPTSGGARERNRGRQQAVRESPLAAWQRGIVLVLPVLLVGFYWSGLNDVFSIPKFTVLVLAAIALVVVTCWRWLDDAVAVLPRGPAAALLGLVLVAMAFTSLIADHVGTSFMGSYGRDAGMLTYLAAGAVFFVVLLAFDRGALERLVVAFAASAVPLVVYGLLQSASKHPIALDNNLAPVVGTLGQANFVGGISGVLLPFLAWCAIRRTHPVPARVAAGAVAVGLLVVAQQSASFQAYASLLAGGGLFGLVWAGITLPPARLRAGIAIVLLVGLLGGAAFHSRIDREVRSSVDERVLFWEAAGGMIKDRPALGLGMGGYAADFTRYRPREHAVRFGTAQISDVPHDVPLGMFVAGGALLGVLYLAFVGYVGLRLARALRALEGEQRLLLGTFGAGWLAYQAQSLVSIDVPTLILVHLVTAAAILVLSGANPTTTVAVPASLGRPRRRGQSASGARVAALGGLVVIALVAAWFALYPWRADAAYVSGQEARGNDDVAALQHFADATSLAPWDGLYWAGRAATLASTGDQDKALIAGERAWRESPSAGSYALSAAQLLGRLGRNDEADAWFKRAIAADPYSAEGRNAWAAFLASTKRYAEAIRLQQETIDLKPREVAYRLSLAEYYLADGQDAKARAVYRKVLTIDPINPTATVALKGP